MKRWRDICRKHCSALSLDAEGPHATQSGVYSGQDLGEELHAAASRRSSRLHHPDTPSDSERGMLDIAQVYLSNDIKPALLAECRRYLTDTVPAIPWQPFHDASFQGLVLHSDANVQVSLMSISSRRIHAPERVDPYPKNTGISIQGADSLVLFPEARRCPVAQFNVDDGDNCRVNPDAETCVSMGEGQHLFLEGGRRGFFIPSSESDHVMVVCTRREPRVSVTRHYMLDSMRLVGLTAASVADSRVQVLITALLNLRGDGAIASLTELVGHRSYFIRWQAVQALHLVAPEVASGCLMQMKRFDEEPEIRQLASNVLRVHGGS